MIKNILAVIGVLSIVAIGVVIGVKKPWEAQSNVVSVDAALAPSVNFDALREDGIYVERVHVDAAKPKAVLYVAYSKFFKATVLLRAYDKSGREVGRSKRVLSGDSEDAAYADFVFDPRVPMKSVTFFTLTKSKAENIPSEGLVPATVPVQDIDVVEVVESEDEAK